MIERTITVTVGNNVSSLNEKLIFYARDRGILIHFILKDIKYLFSNSTIIGQLEPPVRAEIYALKPNGSAIRFDSVTITENTVDFILTETLTDELDEIGIYKLQIVIFSDDDNARLAIPPFDFEVKDLLTRTNYGKLYAETDETTTDSFDSAVIDYPGGYSEDVNTEAKDIVNKAFNNNTYTFDLGENNKVLFKSGETIYTHKLNAIYFAMNYYTSVLPNYIYDRYKLFGIPINGTEPSFNAPESIQDQVLGQVVADNRREIEALRSEVDALKEEIALLKGESNNE